MIRKPKDKTPVELLNIIRIFPIFSWKMCGKCRNEFRFGWGWRSDYNSFIEYAMPYRYFCGHCAKTEEDVQRFVSESGRMW